MLRTRAVPLSAVVHFFMKQPFHVLKPQKLQIKSHCCTGRVLHRQIACAAVVFATSSALGDEMAVAACRADASTNEHGSCAHAVSQIVEGNGSRKVQGKNAEEEEDDGCCLCWCRPKEAGILHGTRYRLSTKHQVFALFSRFHCNVC